MPDHKGEKPDIVECGTADEERRFVISLIQKWMKDDPKHTIGVLCFTNNAVEKIGRWLSQAHIEFQLIKNDPDIHYSVTEPGVKICTMHTSKGLEFMRVILPQFYQGMIPQNWALKDEEILMRQRNVAYVAMTRAMHQLTIVYNGYKSRFIEEMDPACYSFYSFDEAVAVEQKKPTPPYEKRTVPSEARQETMSTIQSSASLDTNRPQGASPDNADISAPPVRDRKSRWSLDP